MTISIVGFWITLVQLGRTQRAAAAVSTAVRNIQFAVSKYDATIEASKADTSLESARKHFKSHSWGEAGEAIDLFSSSLHAIKTLQIAELRDHEAEIDVALSHANRLCERLDKVGMSGLPENEVIKTLSTMRDNAKLLTSLRIALQRSAISE
ncbi:MAG: hypothetical protein ACK4TC_02190 [Sphingomonas pseudosanguinis]|uniref:hypothetical protein n=1 Tax=Sphingomonas pseudosanguinis TaxID=413712 RepID=UPI00391A3BA8